MPTDRSGTVLVAIAGGSGAGKSMLAEQLRQALPELSATLVEHDWYYAECRGIPAEARARQDFDCPAALDNALLAEHLRRLAAGQPVEAPQYCFRTHTRRPETVRLEPAQVVVVCGVLLLAVPELVELVDLRVFLDAPADLRLIRRLRRDLAARGRSVESVIEQYLATVRPAHERLVEPSRAVADLIVTDAADPAQVTRVAAAIRRAASGQARPEAASPRLEDGA